ncbi:head decoration protein [Maritimibacter sp. 55A14]|uniref:head decoration protein n=1 Tax=Maritimibacter sp. 55A14 TaxID=2174844 RepID=UPI000D6120C6|nr:head decoration protein [Maritimibacter sp. 55A14]PWE32773.1 head decoration protein [Maritimibacter sp. 55A14]
MTTLTEGNTGGDFLLFEEDGHYSRDEVTIAAGADLVPGTVLGKITASGKYVRSVETAVDGSETAVAVLLTPAAAASADVTDAIAIAREARVRRGGLVWDATYDNATKRDAAVAALKAVGILTDA